MKSVFLHIVSLFLIACILANIAFSWLYVEGNASRNGVVIDVQKQGLPHESREEKVKSLKDFSCKISFSPGVFAAINCRYFEDPAAVLKQIFLPVILPPPKANA